MLRYNAALPGTAANDVEVLLLAGKMYPDMPSTDHVSAHFCLGSLGIQDITNHTAFLNPTVLAGQRADFILIGGPQVNIGQEGIGQTV